MKCPCGSGNTYEECCEPLIKGDRLAETAEQLMRARYTAYTRVELDFLQNSLTPEARDETDPEAARDWAESSDWHGLTVVETVDGGPDDDTGQVEFIASYTYNGEEQQYHEVAQFARQDGAWFFTEGTPGVKRPIVRDEPKTGRNDPCPCGSGRKFKRCCGA